MSIEHNTVEVTSWTGLQEVLFEDSWDAGIERFRSRFVFRGLDDATYPMTTSLQRIGGPYDRLERHLLRNLRKYAPTAVVEQDSPWHWIVLGQHYGLPTRLMDWTYSPLVALHFATADRAAMSRDAAVWMVHVEDAMQQAPPGFQQRWRDVGGYGLDIETLSELLPTLREFEETRQPFAIFFEPPSIDDRIVNQFAIFGALSDVRLPMDAWLDDPARQAVRFRKIIIPAALKWEVRDKLDHSNVNERMLFPGLGGLCLWLKRYYSPKT